MTQTSIRTRGGSHHAARAALALSLATAVACAATPQAPLLQFRLALADGSLDAYVVNVDPKGSGIRILDGLVYGFPRSTIRFRFFDANGECTRCRRARTTGDSAVVWARTPGRPLEGGELDGVRFDLMEWVDDHRLAPGCYSLFAEATGRIERDRQERTVTLISNVVRHCVD